MKVKNRPASAGRNPQKGKAIKIAAVKVPTFKAGQKLKDSVNGQKKNKNCGILLTDKLKQNQLF
ncbi:HU family DNA-binding protein [Arsenophonus endosymbiont of Bemisia tabaci]|uniref:HU family DNA-binding protein n=1 Tax=Arsenophonus endosymbiont of Bemisia tabaci TaxID=536059 RepID=UPI003B849A90